MRSGCEERFRRVWSVVEAKNKTRAYNFTVLRHSDYFVSSVSLDALCPRAVECAIACVFTCFYRRRWDSIVLDKKIAELRGAETRPEDLLTRK